jgi:hypothetical protein
LPSLRFTRDKRGYETTSLVHAGRHNGRSRQRILYWFRTPPGVKVGRPALDEDAIRWIEEHNPDIEFDWPRILQAQPAPAPPAEDARGRRPRRDRERPRGESARGARPAPPAAPSRPEPERREPEPAEMESGEPEPLEPELVEPEPLELDPLAEAFEQLTHPETEETIEPAAMPVEKNLGREQLTRLRARYAELLTRIAERGGEPERVEALRTQAEPLNPDTWVTDDEVRLGIESFETKIRDLRAALGLRRRRRSRRGGRRRRGSGGDNAPPTENPPSASEPEPERERGEE